MGEIVSTSRALSFQMQCPNCKRGMMIFVGMVVVDQNGQEQYLHACSFCSTQAAYEKKYPTNVLIGETKEVYEQ